MSGPNLTAVLPMGSKMVEAHVDGGLQQHIRALAQAVLQHLFYPVLLRHSVRRRRMLLREAYIERASVSGIASAAESALISASVVGLLLSCDERSGTSPMRGGSSNQDESVPRHTRSTSAISSSSSMCTTLRPSRPMLPYPSKDGGVAPRAPPAFLQQLSMVLSEDGIASQRVRLHIALEGTGPLVLPELCAGQRRAEDASLRHSCRLSL